MAVPEGPTDKRYTGNGVTKIFTIPFLLLAATDLDVYIDGIEISSGFAITNVGNPTSTITFTVAPVDQADIYLQLNVPFERLNDYQENGDFLSSTVNRDFDRIWQALKQLFRWSTRSLRLGNFDVDGAGWYRAKGNGIRDLRDPVEAQDAATRNWVSLLVDSASGVISNTTGIIYDAGTLFDHLRFGVSRTVPSVAAVRLLSSARNKRAFALSYYGDWVGGGGQYVVDDLDITSPDNGGSILVAGDGARWKLVNVISGAYGVEQFGAKCNGSTNDAAFVQAAANFSASVTFPADKVCYIGSKVTVENAVKFSSLGGTVKSVANKDIFNGRTFEVFAPNVSFEGIEFNANGCAFVILSSGSNTTVNKNRFYGDVQHYCFFSDAFKPRATGNTFDCEDADYVGTCIVFERCAGFNATGANQFNGVPVGWGIQVRDSTNSGQILGNNFRQFRYTGASTAVAGQTVFSFTLGSIVNFKGMQINGKPLSKGYTITNIGKIYTVTFAAGRASGEVVRLVGYRGAENIQINNSSFNIAIAGNTIDGTGDSGIVILGDRVTVVANDIRNTAYAGVACYGGQNNITIDSNTISDCSQLDDGQSSPDNPALSSVFCGGILLSGSQLSAHGNTIINDSGTMKYGIRVNTSENLVDGSADVAIKMGGNSFRGTFALGKYFMPNDTTGKRIQSLWISDGMVTDYPVQVDLDGAWTGHPANNNYFANTHFGGGGATRDSIVTLGGVASLRTIAGQYVDLQPTAQAIFKNAIVKVSFWAKNNTGSSYLSVFSTLGGLDAPVTVNITDTNWRQYTLTLAVTDNLSSVGPIRIGANLGDANVQHIRISMCMIPI